jgi:hypothetical protein
MPASLPLTTTRVQIAKTSRPAAGGVGTVEITETISNVPAAQGNLNVPSVWSLSVELQTCTIVFLDVTGDFAQAQFLAIHRITNEWTAPVLVETENYKVLLGPSRSVDVSSAQVSISVPQGVAIDDAAPPNGTYFLLCCSIAVAQASPTRLTSGSAESKDPAMKASNGGVGGGGGAGGGVPGAPGPKPGPDSDLDKVKALEAESARIREKLKIARAHGQADAAAHVEGLLGLVEKHIGEAAIAAARREIEQLGRDALILAG